ncbi:hypothetical protein [Actinomadura madurae]|uniref:hypothetical protein n=1 Tax=Actinomadura madurae TaxID=1993 RepID=UPI0011606E1F|nr:hypothetical protein [Actinomadura madurae]
MRRVRDLAKPATVGEQGELFPAWRYHQFFTDSPFETLQAERHHRYHAVIEQVIADGKASPLAHLPSGNFNAGAAWLALWAMSFQPAARHRQAGLGLPRPCDHRHHPRPPAQHPRPAGPLGPPPVAAPAPALALGQRMAAVVRHHPRPTRQHLTCRYPPPARARPELKTWKSWADQPITLTRGRSITRPSYRKGRKMSLDSPSVDRG